MNGNKIMQALMWPVNDIPAIFDIGTQGFGPALPALVEIGIVGMVLFWDPFKKWKWADLVLAYGGATAASFVLKGVA